MGGRRNSPGRRGRLSGRIVCHAGLVAGPQLALVGYARCDREDLKACEAERLTDTLEEKLNLKWEPNTRLREYLTKAIAYFGNILRTGLSTRPRGLSSSPVWTSL